VSGRGGSAIARLLVLAIAGGLPLVVPARAVAGAGDIATYAGGVGEGTATQLRQVPEYVAVSGTNVYVSDSTLAVVRRIDTTTGRETIVAGSGYGFSGNGGPATLAKLSHPTGLALDSKGDLFISDTYNDQVREVNPSGIITTVAGGGLGGYSGDGGPATSAQLLMPQGLAVDAHDNLFIADSQNMAIRKVDMTTGIIQTFEGTGLFWPTDVAFDLAGDLLIMDSANGRVAKVLATGGIATTIAGGGTSACLVPCPALSDNLFDAQGIAVDAAGNLLIANTQYGVIQMVDKLDGTGTVTNVAGSGQSVTFGGDGGPATAAHLYHPMAVKPNPAGGFVIADQGNQRVRNVDALGTITTIAGTGGCGFAGDGGPAVLAQLCSPRGLVVDGAGDLFVADAQGARIRKVDAGGTISTVAGNGSTGYSGDQGPATQAQLNTPQAVALDAAGNLFIADSSNDVVREVTADGVIHTVAGNHVTGYSGDSGPATSAQLNFPSGVAFDAKGNLLIADDQNHRIRSVDHLTNIITTVAGTGVRGSSGDGGQATLAQLNFPAGVALDRAGNLFIADSGNNKIRKVDPSGVITTVAGSSAPTGGDGGPALNAGLSAPFAVAIGPQSILYIDDAQDQRIRMVTADGIIHTAAGNGAPDARGFSGDGGPATAAALSDPYGLAVDSAGNIFIGDSSNGRVRRVEAYGVPGAPTNVVATGVGGGATVTWTAPPTGGTPITSYTVTPYQGMTPGTPTTINGSPPPTSATITRLVKLQTYTFVVTATNALGAGPPSQASNAVIVYLAPAAPGGVHALAGVSSALVSWTPPADDGGTPILSYTVTPYTGSTALMPATLTGSPPATATVIPGLSNGTFYTFTVAATNKVGTGAASTSNAARPMGGGTYHPLPPARILDTRSGLGSIRAPLANGESRHIPVGGQGPVPSTGVSAVVLNVTVTNTSSAGYLTVYPTGVSRPTASNLNWVAHQTVPNLVEIALGQGGEVDIYGYGSSADVIFDVQGWVGIPGNSGADGLFNGLAPARILDTRDGTGGLNHALGAGATLNLQVTGSLTHDAAPAGVPATGVSAVVLNVTVANPSQASYLTVYPAGGSRPVTSNLNFTAGQTVANRVILKLGTGGAITIFNAGGTVNVIADVNGWFTDAANASGGTDFTGISPARLLDTRTPSWGLGPLQAGYEYSIQLLDPQGAPLAGISAVVVNVTATNPTAAGYLTLWPDSVTLPLASDLNFLPGQTVPNLVVLQLGANATFRIYNPAGSTDVVIDVVGFYGTQDAAFASGAMRAYAPGPPMRVAPSR
jgi:Fibronectin type III domain/NHL repeat